jgi:iron complex transport system substrate-binding protein
MLRRTFLLVLLLFFSSRSAWSATVLDATGRSITVPEHISHVLPAGPPAAILLAAVAPDLMLGWPSSLSDEARSLLAPEAAKLPQVPRLTGREDVADKIAMLKPDLILDYGTVSPRYADLAKATQQRTGVPTLLLNGSLSEIPTALRLLGTILHREERAETLARFTEALLALPQRPITSLRVVCARGPDGLTVVAPGSDLAETFARAGWQIVAPEGEGPSRHATLADFGTLDPDIIVFTDPAMHTTLAESESWRSLRAVREGHAFVAPSFPFGWLDEPPSINRLLGLAWLGRGDPRTLASLFNAVVYGRALTAPQVDVVIAGAHSLQP